MEQDTFQQEIGGEDEFMNADGVVDTLAPTAPTGAAVVKPTGGAPVAGVATPTAGIASPAAANKAARLAQMTANNQARLAKVGAWSTKNAANEGAVKAKIERVKAAIAQREAELATVGGVNANAANPRVQRLLTGLANAKAYQAKLEAHLAKIQANRVKIDTMQANQTAQTAKIAAMSSAEGDEDDDEYFNADGATKKPFEIKVSSVLIGLALGLGIAYFYSKSKTKFIA